MRATLVFLSFIPLLTACSVGVPTAVTYRGHSLTGEGRSSVDMQEFSFTTLDSQVTCYGGYDLPAAFTNKFTFPIHCSDGRSGKVEVERIEKPSDRLGQEFPVRGKIIFSDGAIGLFNLGSEARNMSTQSIIYQNFVEELGRPRLK
jgi:hypothetical protein